MRLASHGEPARADLELMVKIRSCSTLTRCLDVRSMRLLGRRVLSNQRSGSRLARLLKGWLCEAGTMYLQRYEASRDYEKNLVKKTCPSKIAWVLRKHS